MLSIVLETADFIVVDKPSGWLSVPSRLGSDDPRPCVRLELKKKYESVLPVHRLDFEVSGLLMFAKNKKAQAAANAWFEKHDVIKTYCAWTEGFEHEAERFQGLSIWESRLVRGKKRAFEAPHGKPAVTRVRFMGLVEVEGLKRLRWELQPLTGRSHQLRFELSKRRFPIVGDTLYGAQEWKSNIIALRAIKLDFGNCHDREQFGVPESVQVKARDAIFSS